MNAPLTNAVRVRAELRYRLSQEEGIEPNDPVLTDTLAGIDRLEEQIAAVAREAKATEAMAEGLKLRIREMRSRETRLLLRAERLRSHASWAMSEAGLSSIKAPDVTVTLRQGEPPITCLAGPKDVPPEYQRIKVEFDATAIRDAVKRGEKPEFVTLGNPAPVLTIRGG